MLKCRPSRICVRVSPLAPKESMAKAATMLIGDSKVLVLVDDMAGFWYKEKARSKML